MKCFLYVVVVLLAYNIHGSSGKEPEVDDLEPVLAAEEFAPLTMDMMKEIPAPALNFSFDCSGRLYGYYSDQEYQCKYFHVCHPVEDDDGDHIMSQFSFACPDNTIFDQQQLTCDETDESTPCEDAHLYYDINQVFLDIIDGNLIPTQTTLDEVLTTVKPEL